MTSNQDINNEFKEETNQKLSTLDPKNNRKEKKIKSILQNVNNYERIDLDFPENFSIKSDKQKLQCYPNSYYTLSKKERVILLFVEVFRIKFHTKYPNRRPLVLAIKNECNIQKFVCTTIRPTALKFPKLIRSFDECCNFVSDFIVYEPLDKLSSYVLPPQLVSPDTLLKRRQGNSFELATLLCSFLIGEGYPVMIVSGLAKIECTLNDQHNEECPYLMMKSSLIPNNMTNTRMNSTMEDDNDNLNKKSEKIKKNKYENMDLDEFVDPRKLMLEELPTNVLTDQRYALSDSPESVRYHLKLNACEQFNRKDHEIGIESDEILTEKTPKVENGRIHAWIVVIEKNQKTDKNESDENHLNVYFVEPSTGLRHEVTSDNYLRVESIWNHENYYVNIQKTSISDISWDLSNTKNWERFLPADQLNDNDIIDQLNTENIPEKTKILLSQYNFDLTPSWVEKLEISLEEYQQRYKNNEKIVHYKRVIYERYSSYYQKNGFVSRATVYDDDNYEVANIQFEWYENRSDYIGMIKKNLKTEQIEEYFSKGRSDKLKVYKYNKSSSNIGKLFEFYYEKRTDSLKKCFFNEEKLQLCFGERSDLCAYQEFYKNPSTGELEKITDMFRRNQNVPSGMDVAERHFYLTQNKIIVKYHYSIGSNIAIIKEFRKPLETKYTKELIFEPDLVKSCNINENQTTITHYDNYIFLLQLLNDEKILKKEYDKRKNEILNILRNLHYEKDNPHLKFDIFDSLRNQDARNLHIKKLEEEIEKKLKILSGPPDYLAPYLIRHHDEKTNSNDHKKSYEIYTTCLKDVKSKYVRLLNELQKKYDELVKEDNDLEKFISKYHQQTDTTTKLNIDELKEKQKQIHLQKRIIKNRLIQTHEQAQKKYEQLKVSLLSDTDSNYSYIHRNNI